MSSDIMMVESARRSKTVSMETGGLPLVSTFALLTIVAGKFIIILFFAILLGQYQKEQ